MTEIYFPRVRPIRRRFNPGDIVSALGIVTLYVILSPLIWLNRNWKYEPYKGKSSEQLKREHEEAARSWHY